MVPAQFVLSRWQSYKRISRGFVNQRLQPNDQKYIMIFVWFLIAAVSPLLRRALSTRKLHLVLKEIC